jgi:hypothetical protein
MGVCRESSFLALYLCKGERMERNRGLEKQMMYKCHPEIAIGLRWLLLNMPSGNYAVAGASLKSYK